MINVVMFDVVMKSWEIGGWNFSIKDVFKNVVN